MVMVIQSIRVTPAEVDAFEAEDKARLERLAKAAPKGVKFAWKPPALREDGSLAGNGE